MNRPEDIRMPKVGQGNFLRSILDQNEISALFQEVTRPETNALDFIPTGLSLALPKVEITDRLLDQDFPTTAKIIDTLGKLAATKRDTLDLLSGYRPVDKTVPEMRNTDPQPHIAFWVVMQGKLYVRLPLNRHSGFRYPDTFGFLRPGDVVVLNNLSSNQLQRPRHSVVHDRIFDYVGERLELSFSTNK